jgi:adenine-specific DNA glycosylase
MPARLVNRAFGALGYHHRLGHLHDCAQALLREKGGNPDRVARHGAQLCFLYAPVSTLLHP